MSCAAFNLVYVLSVSRARQTVHYFRPLLLLLVLLPPDINELTASQEQCTAASVLCFGGGRLVVEQNGGRVDIWMCRDSTLHFEVEKAREVE